ncbi:unnamed protein product [Acanthoscelides obtectus]|uniref:Uncharacterized protein n=1 Tax=Acanthoscelides obtectus TaxID=200917 RepID=A0A9P0JIS9_ACAOB|nr:unnamed protein product [Acanthoscelides obtectus]CAK1650010.1 hypothetical protein AOBTE_LOCUS16539 [Acanthoscelides obtectus]
MLLKLRQLISSALILINAVILVAPSRLRNLILFNLM